MNTNDNNAKVEIAEVKEMLTQLGFNCSNLSPDDAKLAARAYLKTQAQVQLKEACINLVLLSIGSKPTAKESEQMFMAIFDHEIATHKQIASMLISGNFDAGKTAYADLLTMLQTSSIAVEHN